MSTPLFARIPQNGSGTAPILGASLAAYTSGTSMAAITTMVDLPILVESLFFCAEKFSTLEGQLLIAIVDDYGNRRLVGAYDIPAGTATLMASGVIDLDLTVAPGSYLEAAHNVQVSGPTYTNLHVVVDGGQLL